MSQICPSRLNIFPQKKLSKICRRLVNFCQSGKISPNLVTLLNVNLVFLFLELSLKIFVKINRTMMSALRRIILFCPFQIIDVHKFWRHFLNF